jgi:hypothetical protein
MHPSLFLWWHSVGDSEMYLLSFPQTEIFLISFPQDEFLQVRPFNHYKNIYYFKVIIGLVERLK